MHADPCARVGAMCAVLSVSMLARQDSLKPVQVDDLLARVMAVFPPGDDLRQAVVSFADRYPRLRRDAYALRLLGEELDAALNVALNPVAGGSPRYRSDVDG